MINITLWQNQERQINKFLVEGHAGYGEEGWDIVCAAVSALTIATLNGLTEYVLLPVDIVLKNGYVHCTLPDQMTELQTVQAQAILKTMDFAFQNIKNEYDKYMRINRINL
jgi:hypothetical protein